MYAIIETGGKQYKVKEGDIITVEKLDSAAGASFVFDKVLAVGGSGSDAAFGSPYLPGATVTASVIGDGKGKKLIIYKFRKKKDSRKKKGHRQPFTKLKVEAISAK